MTGLERDAYLDDSPGRFVNVLSGYPDGLNPRWIRVVHMHMPPGWYDVPPVEYVEAIRGYFKSVLGAGTLLTPSCSAAFTIAAQAVLQDPGDEVILMDRSFDCWTAQLKLLHAAVVYAPRASDGQPDPGAVAAAVTPRTRAVVIVSPDNPLGVVCTGKVLGQIADLCRDRGLTLIADHCLAELNPYELKIPLLPQVALSRSLASWIALGDTGKLLGRRGSKLGALAYGYPHGDAILDVASVHGYEYPQDHLALLATILTDRRFPAYRDQVSATVRANHQLLRRLLQPPLTVAPMDAGSFAVVEFGGAGLDAGGAGLTDLQFAKLLRRRFKTLAVPLSCFPASQPGSSRGVRVALARPPEVIESFAAKINLAAGAARAGAARAGVS
jgi:aspartate/methionine/tyrosine aminotransferase